MQHVGADHCGEAARRKRRPRLDLIEPEVPSRMPQDRERRATQVDGDHAVVDRAEQRRMAAIIGSSRRYFKSLHSMSVPPVVGDRARGDRPSGRGGVAPRQPGIGGA